MTLDSYIRFYGLDDRFKPIMEHLKPTEWYLFHSRTNVLKTGFYTGTGANAKRVDMTDVVCLACIKARIKFRAYNDAPRGGVTGNKVEIIFA